MTPVLTSLDHLVLTVADIDRTSGFYREVLGMQTYSSHRLVARPDGR